MTEALPGRQGRGTVIAIVLCQAIHWMTFAAIPLLLPLIREDLQISFTQAGLLSAAGTVSYAICQIPAGYLSDRIGPRRLFFVGLLGWSVLSVSLGLIHSFWLALLNQFVAGAFRALLFAPGLALLASWFHPARRATAMSLFMVGGFAGSVVLAIVGPVLAARHGWRFAFMLFAALGIGAALLYRRIARDGTTNAARAGTAAPRAADLLRQPILWICSGLQVVRFSVVTATNVWLPSLLVADRGLSLQVAGAVVAMSAALSAPANTLGSYISDRTNNPPLVIGASLAVLACTCVLLGVVESIPVLLLVIAVNAVFMQFYFGPLFLVPIEVLGPRIAGTATGFANLFANIGGFATAYALGVVKDEAGSFGWGFVGIGALCVVGMALCVPLSRMRARATVSARRIDP